MINKIYKNSKLPFVELRYGEYVRGCSKSHTHEVITITAIEEGAANLILDNETLRLCKGSLAYLNPSTAHCLEVLNDDAKGDFVLHLDTSWCINVQKELFNETTNYLPVAKVLINEVSFYNNFIELCAFLFSDNSIENKEEELINFISKLFLEHCTKERTYVEHSRVYIETAQKIKTYLDENIEKEITLQLLANTFNFSAVHITRVFKKEFGIPVHAYILNKKVHKARELLSTNSSLSEIALESGFFDQSHFNKSFKRVFSITPKEYQDNLNAC